MFSIDILIIYDSCDQDEVQPESESDDEDQQIYNPLKLPMGWDGKPIPYWLYKLHGLGQVISIYVQSLTPRSKLNDAHGLICVCVSMYFVSSHS